MIFVPQPFVAELRGSTSDMPTSSPRPIVPSVLSGLSAPWRIGVDVGGTFTDLVLIDADGTLRVAKVPSTPRDPSEGVLAAVDTAAAEAGLTVRKLLENCSHFVHGSTVATNVVVERRGAPTGMIVTHGFRDSLEIRRGIRHNAWDHRRPFPPVLVPRYLRCAVRGRLDRHGTEIEPLALQDVDTAAAIFRREGVSSVAICLYNSFLSDVHEVRVAQRLRQIYPDCWVTLSSHVAPIMGEYERGSTAVISAYVAPLVVAYTERIAAALADEGLRTPLLVVQNNGGSLTIERVRDRPAALLLSGPASGIGGLGLCGEALATQDLLSMEIGGTSCDVTLVSKAGAEIASAFDLGGYHVALPSVDIHSIGAGGGTIAGVDAAGMLLVGPRGAGADPGPASYGLGGRHATVTDAQLVLGRLKPGPLAGGRSLDIALAHAAIERGIAKPLGLSVDEAAAGIITLVEEQLFQAVQKISAEGGHDPRRFVLIAAGGAGPMHGSSIGRKLGSPAVYVPRLAGAFCALGMLNAPIKHEYSRVMLGTLGPHTDAELRPTFERLEREADTQLRLDGFACDETELVREIELRHPGQIGTIRVPIPSPGPLAAVAVAEAFRAAHQRLYGHVDVNATIEIAALFVVGIGRLPHLRLSLFPLGRGPPEPAESRAVYFGEACARVPTDVYRGASLSAGHELRGPAIIEETTTCVVVAPGDTCSVDALGNYLIRLEGGAAH
jgi:N-methylhydantoinase A